MSANNKYKKWTLIVPTRTQLCQYLELKIKKSAKKNNIKILKEKLRNVRSAYNRNAGISWSEIPNYLDTKVNKFTDKCVEQFFLHIHLIQSTDSDNKKMHALSAYWTVASGIHGVSQSDIFGAKRRHKIMIKVK